ncbi:Rv1733c family protein [Streptomyces sp. NPDC005151]
MLKRDGRVLWWRWRRNQLKRRSDTAEAWIGVAATAILLLATPAVGFVTAGVAEHSALDRALGLHRVTAHLIEDAPPALSRLSGAVTDSRVRATVKWTTPGGSPRSDTASVAAGSKAGSPTTVWLDNAGRIQPAPPTPTQAKLQGATLGAAAAAGTGMLVVGTCWAARLRLDRRRGMQWDRAWAEFDARRGHRHA